MASEIVVSAKQYRTTTFDGVFKDVGGGYAVLGSGDILRMKIGHTGDEPLLDLTSGVGTDPGESTEGGSSLTITELGDGETVDAQYTLVLGQDDMTMPCGAYDIEILLQDDSNNDLDSSVQDGVLHVLPSMTGNV